MTSDRDILIARYLDASASADEVESLDRQIAADPVAADEVVRSAYLEALLRDSMPATAVAPEQGEVAAPVVLRLPTWRRWAAVAACLVLAVGVTWWVVRARSAGTGGTQIATPARPSRPLLVAGGAGVSIERGATTLPAAGDATLADADRITTTRDGSAVIGYSDDKTRVHLGGATTVRLGRHDGGKRLELLAGSVTCDADHQPSGRPLVVSTPQAKVLVVGTKFDVRVAAGWSRVHVSDGTVRVTRARDGATVDVSGGQYVDVAGHGSSPANALGAAGGKSMGEFWSTQVRPAGIDE